MRRRLWGVASLLVLTGSACGENLPEWAFFYEVRGSSLDAEVEYYDPARGLIEITTSTPWRSDRFTAPEGTVLSIRVTTSGRGPMNCLVRHSEPGATDAPESSFDRSGATGEKGDCTLELPLDP